MPPSIKEKIAQQIGSESHRLGLWWPVFMGLGIWVYFLLQEEPPGSVLFIGGGGACLWAFRAIRNRQKGRNNFLSYLLSLSCVAFFMGMGLIWCRTVFLNTPLLDRPLKDVILQGEVDQIELKEKGGRLLLKKVRLLSLPPQDSQGKNQSFQGKKKAAQPPPLPAEAFPLRKVRLTFQQSHPLPPLGRKIQAVATLMPLRGPLSPQGYPFRRVAYFQEISAVGWIKSHTLHEDIPSWEATLWIKSLRNCITQQIRSLFSQETGSILAALVTGERGEISAVTRNAFTDAGLAHLLAISGLHLSLIAGFLFLLIRHGMALSPFIAERVDLKKAAALGTLPFLLFYLIISGVGMPALRAFLMSFLVMGAIVMDRPPFSMGAVAFAGTFILILFPESVVSPSFQLSFSAVVGLIAVYERGGLKEWGSSQKKESSGPIKRRSLAQSFGRYFGGIILTTTVATYATTPFTMAIFQKFSLQALLGNLMAIPLTAFAIMPLLVLLMILMGAGSPSLLMPVVCIPLERGTQLLIALTKQVADLPGAAFFMPEQPWFFLPLFVAGGLWLSIWQTPWRHWGWGLMGLSFPCIQWQAPPTLMIPPLGGEMYFFDGKEGFVFTSSAKKYTPIHPPSPTFYQEAFLRQTGHPPLSPASGLSLLSFQGKITFCFNPSVCRRKEKALKQISEKHLDFFVTPSKLQWSPQWSVVKGPPLSSLISPRHLYWPKGQCLVLKGHSSGVSLSSSCQWQGCRPWSEKRCLRPTKFFSGTSLPLVWSRASERISIE